MNEVMKRMIALLDGEGYEVRELAEVEWTLEMEHYSALKIKATVKDISSVYDEAILSIDELVKEAEAREKEGKRDAIQAVFDGKNFDLVPLEKIFNDRWLNKSFVMSDIKKEAGYSFCRSRNSYARNTVPTGESL